MNVAIIGAGAMGGMFAARLLDGGQTVCVLDVNGALVEAINHDGLRVESQGETRVFHPRTATSADEIGIVDAAIFFVKGYHTASASVSARPLVNANTTVVTLQNGWGNADVLAEIYPSDQLVMGVSYHSATVLGYGHVAHTSQGPTFVGPYSPDGSLTRAGAIHEMLVGAGFEVTLTPQVRTEIWKKLILNAATLPTAALTRLRAGTMGQFQPMLDLVDALATEAVEIACAQGLEIDLQERLDRIHTVLRAAGQGKASMLQDVEAGRPTEIGTVNGAVVRVAHTMGIDVPLNRAMVSLISGLEYGWAQVS